MLRRAFLRIVMPEASLRAIEPDVLAIQLEPLFGHDLADQPSVAMKQLAALRAFDATRRLSEISGIPTLVLSAGHDPIAPPRFGRALAEASERLEAWTKTQGSKRGKIAKFRARQRAS